MKERKKEKEGEWMSRKEGGWVAEAISGYGKQVDATKLGLEKMLRDSSMGGIKPRVGAE